MTSRPAATDHPVHPLVKDRWSPRAFAPRPVPAETLASLFEAARWSASSYNEQPWRFVVATRENAAAYEALLKCLQPKNQEWARLAPVLAVLIYKANFTHNDTPNRVALYDAGAAAAQLTAEATHRGLVVHQMAGIDIEHTRSALRVPAGFEPATALAIGYEGDPALLPDWAKAMEHSPRSRKPLKDIVFTGAFGTPAHFAG